MISIKNSSTDNKLITEVSKSLFSRLDANLLIESTTSSQKIVHSFLSGIFHRTHQTDKRQ